MPRGATTGARLAGEGGGGEGGGRAGGGRATLGEGRGLRFVVLEPGRRVGLREGRGRGLLAGAGDEEMMGKGGGERVVVIMGARQVEDVLPAQHAEDVRSTKDAEEEPAKNSRALSQLRGALLRSVKHTRVDAGIEERVMRKSCDPLRPLHAREEEGRAAPLMVTDDSAFLQEAPAGRAGVQGSGVSTRTEKGRAHEGIWWCGNRGLS